MKTEKYLQKVIKNLIDVSFQDSRIVESQVVKSIGILKSLPRPLAIQALSEYVKQLKRKEREHTLYVETLIPLSPVQIKEMKEIAERKVDGERTTKITKVLVSINPELLGGFRLRVGDEIWDESVLGKVEQVKEAINKL